MKSRILHIIPRVRSGGMQKQLSLLAAALPRERFEVHVCSLEDEHRSNAAVLAGAGLPAVGLGKSWRIDPLAYARLKRHIRAVKPDIVHTWGPDANLYGSAAGRAAGARHIVAREHVNRQLGSSHQSLIEKHLLSHTDRIVASSHGVGEATIRRGLPENKVRVIPNAVEPSPTAGLSKQQLCDQLGVPAASRLVVAVGRLCPSKRIKDLIWAADLLKCLRDDTHLLIVGEGSHRWRLERYRRQCETADRVHFLGWRSDVPDLLASSDCFWLASAEQGHSSAIMEAMSAGLPVVAADSCGNQEVVLHRETGFLVPVGDRAAFAKWTNVLLGDPQLACEMGRRGQARVREEFSVQRMTAGHAQLYDELLN